VLASNTRPQLPRAVLWLVRLPFFARLPARLIGLGLRREHIRTPVIKP
jgi:hypothetical protein